MGNEKLGNMQADKYLSDILLQIHSVLGKKAKEYVRNDDRLHNFNFGSDITKKTREEVIDGMRLKHEISIKDMRNDLKQGILPKREVVDEKFGDIVNYYILEWMSMKQRTK